MKKKEYKIKENNIVKLQLYLKKLEDASTKKDK
jgi:hypothetical protein